MTADVELHVSLSGQCLWLYRDGRAERRYAVSTALRGAGERRGSGCTPRGWHVVRARIGEGCEPGTVFVGRRSTGEVYTPELARTFPGRDWILTRILWLGGCEPGRNRGAEVDTLRRYIYIHGTAQESLLGTPASHGCVRMGSADLIELFGQVGVGTRVHIAE